MHLHRARVGVAPVRVAQRVAHRSQIAIRVRRRRVAEEGKIILKVVVAALREARKCGGNRRRGGCVDTTDDLIRIVGRDNIFHQYGEKNSARYTLSTSSYGV